VYYKNKSNLPS